MRKLTPHMEALMTRLENGEQGKFVREYGVRQATVQGLVTRGLAEVDDNGELWLTQRDIFAEYADKFGKAADAGEAILKLKTTLRPGTRVRVNQNAEPSVRGAIGVVRVGTTPFTASVELRTADGRWLGTKRLPVEHLTAMSPVELRQGEPTTYVTDIEQAHDQANTEVVVRFVADRLQVKVLSTDGMNNVGRLANQISRWNVGYSEYTLNGWSKVSERDEFTRQWEIMSEVSEHHGCADRATMYLLRNRFNRQQWITSRQAHLTNLY